MTRPKVLFVDDEERIVRLLRMMFRDTYEVFTAVRGERALEIMAEHEIDVLVSDQRMPEMTGIELLSKARRQWPETVRILLTGYSDLVAIIGAVNEGEVFRFLNKPWNQDEIRQVLADAVRTAAEARQVVGISRELPAIDGTPLAKAVMLLSFDGLANDRHEVMEMFGDDYTIITARDVEEALDISRTVKNIGVIIADYKTEDRERAAMLADLAKREPSITIVLIAQSIETDVIIEMINNAKIYRFAMKPIQPNVFRVAVGAALQEHNRRLVMMPVTDKIIPAVPQSGERGAEPGMVTSIRKSLSRFTKVW